MRIIAGEARGTALKTLPGTDVTRPTVARVKEGMFSAVQFLLPGARVLDAFAGSGQLGLEALSRGAASCVFLDESRAACAVVRENAAAARLAAKARVLQTSAGAYLAADVWMVPHHGSRTGADPDFFAAVDPDYAVISAGKDNDYGHPHEEMLELLTSGEVQVLRTDLRGAVVFDTDGTELTCSTQN